MLVWRRSYDTPPPVLDANDPRSERSDLRYAKLAPGEVPLTECLKDTVARVMPLWNEELAPKILAGIVNVNSPTVNDEIHAPMGGVRDSGWGRTGPRSLDDFSDVIWINSHSGQRQYPF